MFTYLMRGKNGYKIGQSKNPEKRLKQLRTADPTIRLIYIGDGVTESFLHDKYRWKRIKNEWFRLKREDVEDIMRLLNRNGGGFVLRPDSKNYTRKLNYKIKFGKYNGFLLSQMVEKEEISYMKWFISQKHESKSSNYTHKMFVWWLKQID